MAGGVEELIKFLAIIITLVVLKNKVNNVYEYILLGAAVGFGFTVVEDFTYGDSLFVLLIRTPLMFTHMSLNMIMGEFIGRAKYNKQRGEGRTALYWLLGLIIPMALHTLYDAGTIFNFSVIKGGNFVVGGILGGAAILTNIVLLIYVLVRAWKNAEKFSLLSVLPKDAQ
jgi:RsiW-degrading membrane proteinase PrsW (M82 family)